jgi:flagellar biosynthesis/type III secretory pathway protein FliH
MNRQLFAPALALAALSLAAPVSAQIGAQPDWNYSDEAPQPYYESRRLAYDNGYREGVKEGERDARGRDQYEFRDERTWQRADKGYHRSYGDRPRYEQSFRSGFEAGYADAYRRYRPSYGGYQGGPLGSGGVYPNTRGGYGYPGQGSNGGYGYAGSPAFANGVSDGYEKGREDARDRDSFDPRRHKWYRSGDHDYKSAYGPKQRYQDVYRQGFQEGYDRGYREWSYGR